MRILRGKHHWASIWLLLGLLACAGIAATAWQYERATRQAQLNQSMLEAISAQQAAEVQSLLLAGADPNTHALPNTPPPSPWQTLAAIVRRLWRHQQPAPRPVYPTALLVAIGTETQTNGSQEEIIKSLLDAGANPNTIGPMPSLSDDLNPPLIWAVQKDQPQIVRLLLNSHANVRAQSQEGMPCLNLVAQAYHPNLLAIAAMLLAQGADVNARDYMGWTPLMETAMNGADPALIKLLLDHGANVSARDPDGHTAFSYCISSNQMYDAPGTLQSVRLILDAGADVNDKDKYGNTVLPLTVRTKAFPLLLSRGAKVFTPQDPQGVEVLLQACGVFDRGREDYSLIETVLALGVSINAAESDGTTWESH